MIYPEVSLKDWLKKYPVLEIKKIKCHHCRVPMIADIPFIEKNWIGLESKDCACGKGKGISISTPRPGV